MARDSRDRIAEQEILAGQEPATADPEATEEAEREAAYAAATRDYVPPQFAAARQDGVLFSVDDLARAGLTTAEIKKLVREGAVARSGMGTVEYDEDVLAMQAERATNVKTRIAILDAGNAVRIQLREMEGYFSGMRPNRQGKYCKRYPYVGPTDETVGINGYVFQIPAYVKCMLPEEVLEILTDKFQALRRKDVLSAVYQARGRRPLTAEEFHDAGDADGFRAAVVRNHHVNLDLIPGNDVFDAR